MQQAFRSSIPKPKSAARYAEKSSQLWTDVEKKYEQQGEYSKLVERLAKRLNPPPVQNTHYFSRALAALARGLAFEGRSDEARAVLARCEKLESRFQHPESPLVIGLTKSLLARQNFAFAEAEAWAQDALTASQTSERFAQFEGDAAFALALCHMEQGRLYLALNRFQQIQFDDRFSNYRRELAHINALWILWDMGRVEDARRQRAAESTLRPSYRYRFDLALAMHDGNRDEVLRFANLPLLGKIAPADALPPSELFHFAGLLAIALRVYGLHESILRRGSWLTNYLRSLLETNDSVAQTLAGRYLKLLGDKDLPVLEIPMPLPWRQEVELLFLNALEADSENLEAQYAPLQKLLAHQYIQTPLMPELREGKLVSTSSWAQALSQHWHLSLQESKQIASIHAKLNKQKELVVWRDGQETRLDLSRSPTTLQVLRMMAGRTGYKLSKRHLHEQITLGRYLPTLHDGRLLKLVSRLEDRLRDQGLPSLVSFQRDNFLHLMMDLEVTS